MNKKHDIIDKSVLYRGEILHSCTILEKDIEEVIGKYFTINEDRAIDFLLMVLDRLTFDSKISILDLILKKTFSETYNKKYEKLFTELRIVKENRNIMAHNIVLVSDDYIKPIKQGIGFVNYRNSVNVEWYDKGVFELLMKRINKCVEVIRDIPIDRPTKG